MPHPLDRAASSAGVLVQAVLDRVPGKRRLGEFLGRRVDFAGAERPIGCRENPEDGFLNRASPWPNLALRLGFRP